MSSSFLIKLAQARPDPGGGAAAAYSAGVGVALLIKVIRLEKSRPYNDDLPPRFWSNILAEARRLDRTLNQLRQADVEAYLAMAQALSIPLRGLRLKRVVEEALRCPWQIMGEVLSALSQVGTVGEYCQRHLLSDLLVATEVLGGALQGAHHIALANLPLVDSPSRREDWANRLSQASHQGLEATLRLRSRLLARTHAASGSG